MKKVIIVDSDRKRQTCNLLWNFISIYAFCLEHGYRCENYSFLRYEKFFNFHIDNYLLAILLEHHATLWKIYLTLIRKLMSRQVLFDNRRTPFYLPPSKISDKQSRDLNRVITPGGNSIYFDGWLFRNPIGIEKYRKEILAYFKPKKEIEYRVEKFINKLRRKYKHVVGVHIRQRDYRKFAKGIYYFSPPQVYQILLDYLRSTGITVSNTVFVICSDEKIIEGDFPGLNTATGFPGSVVDDVFLLSKTDFIIGSNSTYGDFAAYYGNIPIVIFSRQRIDWKQALKKKEFTYYNGCTLLHQ